MTEGSWLGKKGDIILTSSDFSTPLHLWEVRNLGWERKVGLFHTSTPQRSVELRMKKESRDLVVSAGHLWPRSLKCKLCSHDLNAGFLLVMTQNETPGYSCMSLEALVRRLKWPVEGVEQKRFRFLEVWLLFCSQILGHCTPGEEDPSADSGLVRQKISGFLKRRVWSFVPKLNHHSPFCTAMCV